MKARKEDDGNSHDAIAEGKAFAALPSGQFGQRLAAPRPLLSHSCQLSSSFMHSGARHRKTRSADSFGNSQNHCQHWSERVSMRGFESYLWSQLRACSSLKWPRELGVYATMPFTKSPAIPVSRASSPWNFTVSRL